MKFTLFCTRVDVLILLFAVLLDLHSPSKCNFQNNRDSPPWNFLPTTATTSHDFGRIVFNPPSAVLRPQSPKDISYLLSSIYETSFSKVTVAARGASHSIHGQAQALDGIVVEMDSLPSNIKIYRKKGGSPGFSYADVSGGVLWIELLQECLEKGLSPRSWTDYLYLSIGGTLSNGGISGQTFKYGPQISNVLQLDVVTGTGEFVTCSPTKSSELFYAVLGGLGQFGIITSARILLQDAPQKVKWIRAFYDDFEIFIKDQELLISMPDIVDYVEGFVVLNEHSLHSSSTSFPLHLDFIPQLQKDITKVYYCIEFAVYVYQFKEPIAEQAAKQISKRLNHMPSLIYTVEVSYFDFLNRVRMEEMSLRRKGLWDIPHPWLNMFVPKSGITRFKDLLMESISPQDYDGLILIYPILRDKWDSNTSFVLPESDEVVYAVGMLRSANPNTCTPECLRDLLLQTRRIADLAADNVVGGKQYLPHHPSQGEWRDHFGKKQDRFVTLKTRFDPHHILAPGQGIFQRRQLTTNHPFQ